MNNQNPGTEVLAYGQALIKILQGFDIVEPKAAWFERFLIKLLRITYRQRLRSIVELVPPEIGNQIFAKGSESRQNNKGNVR